MAFLQHLLMIVGGIAWLAWLISAPRTCFITTVTLGAGYWGSSDGFLGTVVGLLVGGIGGSAVVGVLTGLAAVARRIGLRLRSPPRAQLSPNEYEQIAKDLLASNVSKRAWTSAWHAAVAKAEEAHAEKMRRPEYTDSTWRHIVEAHNEGQRAKHGVFLPPPPQGRPLTWREIGVGVLFVASIFVGLYGVIGLAAGVMHGDPWIAAGGLLLMTLPFGVVLWMDRMATASAKAAAARRS